MKWGGDDVPEEQPRVLNLAHPNHYDIACALRGPDNETEDFTEELKMLTTAVLRYCVGVSRPGVIISCSPENARKNWENFSEYEQEKIALLYRRNCHFVCHIRAASEAVPAFRGWMGWLEGEFHRVYLLQASKREL